MAVAIGVPTVSLFAVSGPAVSGPAYDFDKHIVIHRPAAVTVSSKTDNDRWMAEIPPEDVLPAVLRLIDSDKEHKHE